MGLTTYLKHAPLPHWTIPVCHVFSARPSFGHSVSSDHLKTYLWFGDSDSSYLAHAPSFGDSGASDIFNTPLPMGRILVHHISLRVPSFGDCGSACHPKTPFRFIMYLEHAPSFGDSGYHTPFTHQTSGVHHIPYTPHHWALPVYHADLSVPLGDSGYHYTFKAPDQWCSPYVLNTPPPPLGDSGLSCILNTPLIW